MARTRAVAVPRVRTRADDEPQRPPRLLRLFDAVLIVTFLGLVVLLGAFPLKDTDFWWHLRTGDWIREHGRVPDHDLYTFTVPEKAWIDLHWGFQVALSWGFEHAGIVGLNLAKCAITAAAVLLLLTARRRDWPIWVMVLAWLPALILLSGRMYVRPETVSLLFLAIDLAVLSRWDRHPRLAYVLPVVQVGWVNTQGLFVFGPLVVLMALADAALKPGAFAPTRLRWWRTVGIACASTGLACLVNPYGISGALFPIQLLRTMGSPIFASQIAELTPIPEFVARVAGPGPILDQWLAALRRNFMLRMYAGTLALGVLSFVLPLTWHAFEASRRPRPEPIRKPRRGRGRDRDEAARPEDRWISPFRLILFVAFSVLSWRATRNSHQFAAVVGAVTAWNFGAWAAAIGRGRIVGSPVPRVLAFGCLVCLIVGVASGGLYTIADEGRTVGLGEEPFWFPREAVRTAGRPGMPPRCLAFHLGHAALYEYEHGPGRKVFADARLEVIGPALFERYVALQRRIGEGAPGWDRELQALGRPVVLVDTHPRNARADGGATARVAATLLADPRWACVWFDPMAAVFVHRSNAEAARLAVDFGARHFRPDPATEPRGGVPELVATAQALDNVAEALAQKGRADRARPLVTLGLAGARRALRADPDAPDGWKVLGRLELARMIPADSEPSPRFREPLDPVLDLPTARVTYALRRALARAPDDVTVLYLLAEVYLARGMDEAALPLLDRLVVLSPGRGLSADVRAGFESRRDATRARLGTAPDPLVRPNGAELERAVNARLASGRAGSAADLVERDVPAGSRSWPLADRLATLHLHLGEPDRARSNWQAARSTRPALRSARVALTYLVEGAWDEARRAYRRALADEPGLFEAHFGLAVLEHDAGRASESLAAARAALTRATGDPGRSAVRAILEEVSPHADPPDHLDRKSSPPGG